MIYRTRGFKSLLLAISLFGLSALIGQTAYASSFLQANENVSSNVERSKTIDGSAYIAGDEVRIDGVVKGDLFCAGEKVKISGTIEGDVLCAGADIVIDGNVEGSVRAIGNKITVEGNVKNNLSTLSPILTFKDKAIVGGDMTVVAGKAAIQGTVERDVLLSSSSVMFDGVVGRDVIAATETINFGQNASVKGDFSYESSTKQNIPDEAVAGEIHFDANNQALSPSEIVWFGLLTLFALILFCILVVIVLPRYVHENAFVDNRRAVLAFLSGFAFIGLGFLLSILLLISGVGGPAGLTLFVAWIMVLLLSLPFSAYFVGQKILARRAKNAIVVQLVGACIIILFLLVPGVNILVFVASVVLGTGLQVMSIERQFSNKPYKIVD